MTKPGRIPCLNPRCNRTAPAEKHAEGAEIVCQKCWKLTPKELRDRYASLKKRQKSVERLLKKRPETDQKDLHFRAIWRQMDINWGLIRAYWCASDAEKPPEGLENFLESAGIGR